MLEKGNFGQLSRSDQVARFKTTSHVVKDFAN